MSPSWITGVGDRRVLRGRVLREKEEEIKGVGKEEDGMEEGKGTPLLISSPSGSQLPP